MTFSTAVTLYAAYICASSAVNSMSAPVSPRGMYTFMYKWLHKLTDNVEHAVEQRYHIELERPQSTHEVETTTHVNPI